MVSKGFFSVFASDFFYAQIETQRSIALISLSDSRNNRIHRFDWQCRFHIRIFIMHAIGLRVSWANKPVP